jgi:hypothetical protein
LPSQTGHIPPFNRKAAGSSIRRLAPGSRQPGF